MALFSIPFPFYLIVEKGRRMERINKLQKKIIGNFLGYFLFPNVFTFIIKNAIFQKDRPVWPHSCKLTVLTYFILSFVCLTFIRIHTAKSHAINTIINMIIPSYLEMPSICVRHQRLPYKSENILFSVPQPSLTASGFRRAM